MLSGLVGSAEGMVAHETGSSLPVSCAVVHSQVDTEAGRASPKPSGMAAEPRNAGVLSSQTTKKQIMSYKIWR